MKQKLAIFSLPLLASSWLLFWDKGDFVLWVNERHTTTADLFFRYFTEVGSWFAITGAFFAFLFVRYRYSLLIGVAGLLSGSITFFGKRVLFPDYPRPSIYFGNDTALNFVEGVSIRSYHSFPSGHTATAFALTFMLALIVNRPIFTILMMITASLVGLSRIYLLLHFYTDTFVGAIIGIGCSAFVWYFLQQQVPYLLQNEKWENALLGNR